MSGSTIGGLAGAGIGFVVGGPAGAKFGAWIGSMAGGLIAPGTVQGGPKLGDAQAQTSMAGAPRPVVFGHPAPFAGNLIDGETKARKVTRKTKQGKGGPTVKTEVFLLTSAIRVCEGPIGGYVRIWEDGVVVYDARTTFPDGWEGYSKEIRVRQAKWLTNARLYLGGEDQLPDPSLEAIHGVGNTPYYRGTAYIVVKDAESQDGTAKRYMFEVASAGTEVPYPSDAPVAPDAFYKLDDASTGVMLDSSGGGHHGAYGGNVADGAPIFAASSGSTQFVDRDAFAAYIGTAIAEGDDGTWTAEISFRIDSLAADGVSPALHGAAFKNLFSAWGSEQFDLYNYSLRLDGTGKMVPYGGFTRPNQDWILAGGSVLDMDTDYHATVTKGIGGLKVYINGALAGTSASSYADDVGSNIAWGMSRLVVGSEFYGLTHGFVGRAENLVVYSVEFSASEVSGLYSRRTGASSIPDAPGAYYDPVTRELYVGGLGGNAFDPDAGVDLDYVEEQICLRCNIPVGKLDFSDLGGITIPGFLVTDQPTGADTLLPLMQANFHDLPEVDGLLMARLRGGAVVMSFTDDDLIDTGEDEEVVRPQEIEFPLKVSVVTQDPDADYSAIPQVSLRFSPSVRAANEVTLQVPIPYRADDAAKIAHKLHKIAWSNAEANIERVLPQEFALLVPSDPVTYDNRRWLVIEREYTDGEVRIKAVYERASDVSSTATGQPVPAPTPPSGSVLGPTLFQAMNLPRLRMQDNVTGVYLGAAWPLGGAGADIYLSTDGGLTEQLVLTMDQPTKMGELIEDEPVGGEPITVRLYDADDTLDNVTTEQVAAGQNVAAIVGPGDVAELIGFEDATETSGGDWELTTLTRGVLRTTQASHLAGERFVPVDYLYFLPIDASLAGQTLIFRAVTQGTAVDANPTTSLVFRPQFTGPADIGFWTTNTGAFVTTDDGSYLQVTNA